MISHQVVPPGVWQIGSMATIRQRLGAARFNYNYLARGSSRIVFDLGNGSVLKLALNKKGLAQNKQELQPSLIKYYGDYLVPVLAGDPGGRWVIQKKAEPLSEREYYQFRNQPEGLQFDQKLKLLSRLEGLIHWDLVGFSNLGKLDGNVLVMDFGLTNSIYERYYTISGMSHLLPGKPLHNGLSRT